jgi:hypothetical protein
MVVEPNEPSPPSNEPAGSASVYDCAPAAEHVKRSIPAASARPSDGVHAAPESEVRITLRQLLVLVTLSAVLFSVGRSLPIKAFAGMCGLLVVLCLLFSPLLPKGIVWQLAWWLLLAIYLAAATVAVFQ